AAIENNELVSPPAGAIGRGDAFVLTIANKANAVILSNDSFQEFHGDYPWLFEGDRLLGGKPVPHVGWVFVPRAPVRGPVSRHAAVNDLLPFLSFVEEHPVGTMVEATTESYSSHGAYVRVGDDVRAYVPLRYLDDPAPRSARDVLTLGETTPFVVVSFNPPRR